MLIGIAVECGRELTSHRWQRSHLMSPPYSLQDNVPKK